jgi:epoxyqueuosine reductase
VDRTILTDLIKEAAHQEGFDLVGISSADPFNQTEEILLEHIRQGLISGLVWFTPERASFSCDPANLMPQVRSIISLGISYLSDDISPIEEANQPLGRIARYAWGQDYHSVLRQKMERLFLKVQEMSGAREARFLVDTARIVDRAVGQRAGLGFFGKNTMLINKGLGSYFFLCEILTDLELETDEEGVGTCGKCTRCLDVCPTGALLAPWKLHNDLCISYLTIEYRGSIPLELRPQMGQWVFGCDLCQEVCPYNRKVVATNHREFTPPAPGEGSPSLLNLLQVTETDEAFRTRFRGSPLLRPHRAGLRRNVAVALGNAAQPNTLPALYAALESETDAVAREHLQWAIAQIEASNN